MDDMVSKMNYYIKKSEEGAEFYEADVDTSIAIARKIREELRVEYKNNNLQRINSIYSDNDVFRMNYKPAIHEALVSVTGRLTHNNVFGFLYDVKDYMLYNLPETDK